MKPLYKIEQSKIPLKLDKTLVERIDVWAAKLSMTRCGIFRFMIRLSGPIVETMVETMTEDLAEACKTIKAKRLILDLSPASLVPIPRATTLEDERRRAEASGSRAAKTDHTSRSAAKPDRGQESPGQTHAQAKARGKTSPQARAGRAKSRARRSPVAGGLA